MEQFYGNIIGRKFSELSANGYTLLQDILNTHDLVIEELYLIESHNYDESDIDFEFEDPRSLFVVYDVDTDIIVNAFYAEWKI